MAFVRGAGGGGTGARKVSVSTGGEGIKGQDGGESAGLGGGVRKAAVGSKIGALGAGLHFNPAGEAFRVRG